MDHTEAIIELKKVINPTITKNLIALIDKKSKDKLQINDGGVNQNVRNVNGYHLNFATPTNLFYWNVIKKEIERVYALYKAKFPKMMSIKINQIDFFPSNFMYPHSIEPIKKGTRYSIVAWLQ